VQFPADLYRKIQKYIKVRRRQLTRSGVKHDNALFLSCNGLALALSSINYVLEKYNLRPHDGAVKLTSRLRSMR
jgi:site-specific recombinase XerD